MADNKQKNIQPVTKPYLKGSPTDERTMKSALGFLGLLVVAAFMCFLVCSMTNFDSIVLRLLINLGVEALVLLIFFNNASGRGSDAVARGEILYQRQEKGLSFEKSERDVCFHPLKGYLVGLLGSVPLLIIAIILAVTATRQATGAGALPSWMNTYQRRTEIGDALVAYTVSAGMTLTDVTRLIIRIVLMPFVSIVGTENRDGMLLLERLSPLLVLLPTVAYGSGYLTGRSMRTRVHTEIASNNRKRARREKKAQRARRTLKPKGPEQLN